MKNCKHCGSQLGKDCGDAEPDYNEHFCSVGCMVAMPLQENFEVLIRPRAADCSHSDVIEVSAWSIEDAIERTERLLKGGVHVPDLGKKIDSTQPMIFMALMSVVTVADQVHTSDVLTLYQVRFNLTGEGNLPNKIGDLNE